MAQAQILHQQRSCGQPQDFRHQFPLLQPTVQYTPHSFGYAQEVHHFTSPQTMSHASQVPIQRQHTSDEFAQHPRWASQQQLSQAPNSSLVANDGASQGYEFALNQFWAKQPGLDQIAGWDYDAQRVAPELSGQYHQNNHLCYDPEAALNVAATRHNSYSGQIGWMPTMVGGDIAGTCASVSEFDSISSLSPQSYFSDRVDNSFSPCSVSDQASSRGDWTTSTSPSAPFKMSSPQLGSSIPYSGYVLARNSNFRRCPDLTGLPGGGFSLAGPSLSVHANNAGHALETPFDGGHQHSADGSLVSMTAPSSSSSWYMSGHSPSRSDVKLTQPDGRAYKTEHDDNGIASSASNHSSSSHGSPSSEGSCSDLHVQVNEQACFKTSQTLDTEAQRQRNDDLLLQGKRDGLTYREIRNKMLGEKPAESTLRGRYRSLTKARKDRVRKPVWHKRDIELLNGFVGQELERIGRSLSNPSVVNLEQKLVKVRWKEVAEYIEKRGGSYHFGNSTCKRKWKELNSESK